MKEKMSVLIKGFTRMLSGSFVAALFIAAVEMFRVVPKFTGYKAFTIGVAGACMVIWGCVCFYFLGGGRLARGKFSK